MSRRAAFVFLLVVLLPASARAQDLYAEDPTRGLDLPVAGTSGDADATAVSLNPGGLVFLGGTHLELALTAGRVDDIVSNGAGIGVYAAAPLDLPFLPRLGFGVAVERWMPPRIALATDPGEPVRLSLATAWAATPRLGVGVTWHHFIDSDGANLDTLDTFDLGLSVRLGRHWAAALVVRDLLGPSVGGVPVQRRWDVELLSRPLGTDRLELAAGMVAGERRLDADLRARLSVRVGRGAWIRGGFEARQLWQLDDPGYDAGAATRVWDLRGTLGLELSFGSVGVGAYGTGGGGDVGSGFYGGTTVVRWSGERLPSVIGHPQRIERIRLEGGLSERELTRTILRLRAMEEDDCVQAVFVMIDGVAVGFAGAQELRDAIFRLRERHKLVFAYLFTGGTRDYYIASAADRVYLDAAGGLRLQGLTSTVLFFKLLFDFLGVEAQFEKIEEFKSAPEAFTRFDSSEDAARMREWLFDDLYHQLTTDIARDRRRTPAEVKAWIDGGPYTAAEAAKAGIVDAAVEPNELDALIATELGGYYPISDGVPRDRPDSWELGQLAIIYLDGDIVDGKSMTIPFLGRKLTGGDTIAQSIAWARSNPRVKAIVLRIDSPGGSATASEVIWREVYKTRGVKPIVVSMGDIAASGGYFAAAGGDVIFAQPSTFTGSIGIFTGKFDLSFLLSRFGLRWETTNRGARADMESYFRPYTDEERKLIKEKLRYYYDRFIGAVAKGRPLTKEQVDEVGRGQVWTGKQARGHKLVDELGGLADAIVEAKKRAGLDDDDRLEVVMLPRESQSLLGQILRLTGGEREAAAGERIVLGELLDSIPGSLIVGRGVPQARLPFDLIWE